MRSSEVLQRWNPRPEGDLIYGTPFVVRGHHLANLRLIAAGEKTPAELAQCTVAQAIRLSRWTPFEAIDLIGTSDEEKDRFHETLEKYFMRFNDLPDDFPIKIVTGQEDGICSGCAVGNHCAKKVNSDADIEYASQFINIAGGLDMGEGQDTPQPTIDTTARAIRKVLRNWQDPVTGQL